MKSYSEKVQFRYKMIAKIYDLMDTIGFPIKKYNPRLGLAGHIPNENISVLDVCFGTGNTGISIAARNDGNKVVGIDISEQMLKVAQNKIRREKLDNITLIYMDAARINLKEEFDVVTTSLSLHEMPKDIMNSVISGMGRVLKSDGKMNIIEWDKPKSFLGFAIFMFFPYLFEPKGFGDFLRLDWKNYLKQYGLKIE
jgi:demethylmenaquinone methyltransferase / 2-methoxy-6-polyprenyl-1,4-benzoquinol methylase